MVMRQLGRTVLNIFDSLNAQRHATNIMKNATKKGIREAVEEANKQVDDLAKEVGEKVAQRRSATQAEKGATRKIREAVRTAGNDAPQEAINRGINDGAGATGQGTSKPRPIKTPVTSYDYRHRINDGVEVFERRPTGAGDDAYEIIGGREYIDARRAAHARTDEFTYESRGSSDNLPAVIDVAQENAESGAGFWDGIPDWAKYTGVAVAGAVVGNALFDDD